MIRQPDFVTEAIAQEAIQRSSKLPEDLKEQVVFKRWKKVFVPKSYTSAL